MNCPTTRPAMRWSSRQSTSQSTKSAKSAVASKMNCTTVSELPIRSPAKAGRIFIVTGLRSHRRVQRSMPGGTSMRGHPSNSIEFRRLLENLPAGAYMCDPDGLITYFNPQSVQLWGRAPKLNDPTDRFCGSFKLFSADGIPIRHDQCWMALALQNNTGYNGQEILVERPTGERLTVLAHANPVRSDSGELLG